jgi:hypothetical protein
MHIQRIPCDLLKQVASQVTVLVSPNVQLIFLCFLSLVSGNTEFSASARQ